MKTDKFALKGIDISLSSNQTEYQFIKCQVTIKTNYIHIFFVFFPVNHICMKNEIFFFDMYVYHIISIRIKYLSDDCTPIMNVPKKKILLRF
jgi:uncharacterized membrane protein YobD (UPF0266 family)